MLEIRKGNIFESDSEALVNPVNIEGVMGKGLAYQFKLKYPQNFENYLNECKNYNFDIGTNLIYTYENGKMIINFPTKRKWRENSKLAYIEIGLAELEKLIKTQKIKSISIPPLGAGNGKLDWELVKKLLINFEKRFQDEVKIVIYEPTDHELKLGKPHLLLIKIILRSYDLGISKKELTDFTLQKITYLTDRKNYFKFIKYQKGPFSKLINIIYNELKQYSRVTSTKIRDIEMELDKKNISDSLKSDEEEIFKGIILYNNFKKFFNLSSENMIQLQDKLELLATVIFILSEKKEKMTESYIYEKTITWNDRKAKKYSYDDIIEILKFLLSENYLIKNIFGEYELIK